MNAVFEFIGTSVCVGRLHTVPRHALYRRWLALQFVAIRHVPPEHRAKRLLLMRPRRSKRGIRT